MAGRPGGGPRRTASEAARDLLGSRDGDSLVPIFTEAGRGSDGDTSVRDGGRQSASVRDDAGAVPAGSERKDRDGAVHGDGGRLRAGGNGRGGNNQGRKSEGPAPIGEVVGPMLSVLETGYRSAITETIAGATEARIRGDSGILNKVEAFSDLLSLSLQEAMKIMQTDVGIDHPLYAKLASTKQAIMASVFSTAARIDETALRRQNASKLDEILQIVREEELLLKGSKTIEAKPSVQ